MALRDIIGQDRAVHILVKTIQRGRIPSSYLFAGESGIGKKFAALNLAKALNCLTLPSPPLDKGGIKGVYDFTKEGHEEFIDCCDECTSCRKIDKGLHPDVLEISPESGQIRIEEIRDIDNVLAFKAFEGKYKVVIVDDADTMNQFAANAFLKTLEEPPQDSLIILVSSNPDRLPDTVRSRCSRINFAPLSLQACEEVIRKFAVQESKAKSQKSKKDPQLPPSDSRLPTLVRLSMGCPGNAVSADLIEERKWFLNLLKGMLNAERDGWTSREDMEKWFNFALILLRDMAIMKVTGDETNIINTDLKEYMRKLSTTMDLKVIIERYQRLDTLRGYFNFNLNKSLTWNYTGSMLRKEMDVTHA